ncbi:MAG: HAMP domain-containing histidine kinase [Oscillospiraceae bacterium]|nr:HAMP domain-containing histidine kinase [Oscillospiraceae bacterium]
MKKQSVNHTRAKYFAITIFVITFIVMATLTTIQNYILGAHIDYTAVPPLSIIIVVFYWTAVSAGFTLYVRWQINKNYDQPMQRLAKATREVAGGDFSVYVRPLHTADKIDYLDVMIEDFNKMVAELGSIETLKTEFFSNVSHEIKTPLSVIQSNAEMLRREHVSDELRRAYADAIIASTKKLSGLITNILKLNRLEQQKIQPTPEAYDLCAQLSECALQFEDTWEEKGIDFEADLEDRATIVADESLLELVWNNLLSNAIKFTGQGGAVTLAQTSTADEIIVTVSDTGCGMSEETLRHIFDKFFQGDTSHATEGNGLGLALSLRILQLSGGTITAKSVLGSGSEFTVRLPVQQDWSERKGEKEYELS